MRTSMRMGMSRRMEGRVSMTLIIIKGYASIGSASIVAFKSGRKTLPCLTSYCYIPIDI